MKTFNQVLASIERAEIRYSIIPDADLESWAHEAIHIFNHPPEGPAVMMVELIGRQLAERLHIRLADHLPPSEFRLNLAFGRAMGDMPADQKHQLAMWSEVVVHYLSELST